MNAFTNIEFVVFVVVMSVLKLIKIFYGILRSG